MLKILTN